ncbi:glycosyltransferase [Pontibacter silvestris]|uniref:Glycosyltransferase n=1 Tax=Pontibacter silvestris TaxID=2305183 RepID=A0ABW4WZ49_9BACT|nr:glycosyltransferase [Pontibacter silvestris]MCC9138821.1 glycosyltransferase [Pontibacter silvestris]
MKERYDLVVVMPIGPSANPAFIEDTLNSFIHYTSCNYKIIIADDSQKGIGQEIKKKFPDINVQERRKNLGKGAALYINLALAYKYAVENYNFDALFKIDDDALITGKDPEAAALKLFRENPDVGMAGRYQSGRYYVDTFGNVTDNFWHRQQLIKFTCSWKLIRRPIANMTLRKLFLQALWNGYEIGENIQGGAYFMSERCLIKLNELGLLPQPNLKTVKFEEDHIFSLMTKYIGMDLADLQNGDLPCGITWKGLPASPKVLKERGKKIIHSVRSWEDMKEDDIRAFFKKDRVLQKEEVLS